MNGTVMSPGDVRVFVETELEALAVSSPVLLTDLYRLGVEVHILPIDDRGVPEHVHLSGNHNGIAMNTYSFEELRDGIADFGEGLEREVDQHSWFVRDCDLAVALAQLLVNEHDIEAARMLGPLNRYNEAVELIRRVERDNPST